MEHVSFQTLILKELQSIKKCKSVASSSHSLTLVYANTKCKWAAARSGELLDFLNTFLHFSYSGDNGNKYLFRGGVSL